MSSSVTRMRRPLPRPFQGSEVREGQAITMFSPRPRWFFTMCFCRPSPKATSSATDTVPQVMPNRVRAVRSFWWRTSWSSCRRKEKEFTRGPPTRSSWAAAPRPRSFSCRPSATSTLSPSESPVLIFFIDGRRVPRARHLDRGLAVREGHEPLGKEEHVGLLPHHDVGVGRVAGPQDHVLGGQQLDLHVEEGGPLLGLRLGRDLVDLALHLGLGQGSDLDPRRHPLVELAHVDLVDRALEDELAHVGEVGEGGARLVGGEGHHRIAFVDQQLEHRARGGGPDDRLHGEVLALHPALLGEGELLAGQASGGSARPGCPCRRGRPPGWT